MCLLPENEQFAAMDDMGQIDKVVLPVHPVHELEPHVSPIPSSPMRSFVRASVGDFLLFWSLGLDMRMTRLRAWASHRDWGRVWLWCLFALVVLQMLVSLIGIAACMHIPFFQHLADRMSLPYL